MATVSSVTADAPARSYHRVGGVLLAATGVVVAAAYGPSLVTFFYNQWQRPHYQHFPFILGAFAWLLWTRLGEATPRPIGDGRSGAWFSATLLAAAWVLIAIAASQDSPWLAAASAALLIAWGFVRIARDWRVTYLWAIWLVFLLVIPLPLNRDQTLITTLQRLSSQLSSFVLDWLGVLHLMEGNTLSLLDKQFFVDEACSGIISVMSIIACALIFGVWQNRPPLHLTLLILAGIAWATIMNVFRICTVAVAYDKFGIDWSAGTPHEMLSLVIFTLTFLGLVSTDLALVAAMAPITEELESHSGAEARFGGWLIRAWDFLVGWRAPVAADPNQPTAPASRRLAFLSTSFAMGTVPLVAFALVAGLQVYQLAVGGGLTAVRRPIRHLEAALAIDAKSLPATLGAFRQVAFEKQEREALSDFGEYSRTFRYEDDKGREYLVSCDFPFGPEWHDLTVCYKGVGWDEVGTRTLTPDRAPQRSASKGVDVDKTWEYMDADFQKPGGMTGYFAYAFFTDEGEPANPPYGSVLRDSLSSLFKRRLDAKTDRMYQIQVWTTSAGKLDDSQRAAAADLLLAVRKYFLDVIVHESAPGNPLALEQPASASTDAPSQKP